MERKRIQTSAISSMYLPDTETRQRSHLKANGLSLQHPALSPVDQVGNCWWWVILKRTKGHPAEYNGFDYYNFTEGLHHFVLLKSKEGAFVQKCAAILISWWKLTQIFNWSKSVNTTSHKCCVTSRSPALKMLLKQTGDNFFLLELIIMK